MGFEQRITVHLPDSFSRAAAFAEGWSQATLLQYERYLAAQTELASSVRTAERMVFDYPIDPTIEEHAWHRLWTEGHLLLISALQLENWIRRHNENSDEESQIATNSVQLLRTLRNAVEHLDEANIDEGHATPDESRNNKNWSLSDLPKGKLPLSLSIGRTNSHAFGIVEIKELEALAHDTLASISLLESAEFDDHIHDHWKS